MGKTGMQERDIENLLEQKLQQKGYDYNLGSGCRNVYMQRPRTQQESRLLRGLRPDYLIYFDRDSVKPNIIIEVKKPNMHLKSTLKQGLQYAHILGAEIVIIYDGIHLKSFYTDTEQHLTIDGLEVSDIQEISIYKKFINDKRPDIHYHSNVNIQSKQDLISVFADANNKLRKAGMQQGIERFTEFSNLLFLKLISEENDIIHENIPEHIKWDFYKNKTGEELYSYINDVVIVQLEKIFNMNLFSKLLIQDKKSLKQIIDKLDQLQLSKIQTDIKGDAFEYFIQKYNSTNKDLGQYFTPRHIVNFLVNIAKPKYAEKIYDPFCGTGGMLIAVFNYIYADLKNNTYLTDTTLQDLKQNTLYGSEISSTAKITKMNMILTGDGHTNIQQQNTLKNPVDSAYDIVITNIPFNLPAEPNDLYYTFSTDGNCQCIEHIIKSLKKSNSARAFVIVPEGFLNNSEAQNTRKYIVDNNLLRGIISLPSGVFLPYTDTKTSILALKGFNSQPTEKIYYYKVHNDGYTLTTRRRKKNGINDLDEFLSLGDDVYAKYMAYEQIAHNDNYSFMYFKYDKTVPAGYIALEQVIAETKIKNFDGFPTQTITNQQFYGIATGQQYWGENFMSVTSKSNTNYKVIHHNHFAYNPSRINVGSLGINISRTSLAVSSAYTTFKVYNDDFLPEYVYHYLKSKTGIEAVQERSFGSVRQALRFEDLKHIYLPVISKQKQQQICEKARLKYNTYMQSKQDLDSFHIDDYYTQ